MRKSYAYLCAGILVFGGAVEATPVFASSCTTAQSKIATTNGNKGLGIFNAQISVYNKYCTELRSRRNKIERVPFFVEADKKQRLRMLLAHLATELKKLPKQVKDVQISRNKLALSERYFGTSERAATKGARDCSNKKARNLFVKMSETARKLKKRAKSADIKARSCAVTLSDLKDLAAINYVRALETDGRKSSLLRAYGVIEAEHQKKNKKASIKFARYFMEGKLVEKDLARAIRILSSKHLANSASAHAVLSEVYWKRSASATDLENALFYQIVNLNRLGPMYRSSPQGALLYKVRNKIPKARRDKVFLRAVKWLKANGKEVNPFLWKQTFQ